MSATQSIHSEISLNKKEIAKKLERLTDKVMMRGIYVIEKNSWGYYNLLEYTKKRVILADVPSYKIADAICNALNDKQKFSKLNIGFLHRMIELYHKLDNDCLFYRHTIHNTKDDFKRDVTITRLDLAVQQLKNVHTQLVALN